MRGQCDPCGQIYRPAGGLGNSPQSGCARLTHSDGALRGRFGVLGPFLGEGEYSGFVFGEDVAVDHAFQLCAGAFDVLR